MQIYSNEPYSFSYLRKVVLIGNPVACVKPSIITFGVLAVIGLAVNVAGLLPQPWHQVNAIRILGIAGLVAFYGVMCYAFDKITRQGFSRMEPHKAEAEADNYVTNG